jgi:uncharacterized protein
MIKYGLFILLLIAGILLTFYLLQDRLLYHPSQERPSPAQAKAQGCSLWPSAEDFRGLLFSPTGSAQQETVVVFHGNAGAAQDRSAFGHALSKRGFRVVLLEYPGYGGRAKSPSEHALVLDSLESIALLRQQFGDALWLWGESLGCGVAASVTARLEPQPKGLALLTPWDNLTAVAKHHYGYLPVDLLLRDRYDSIANLADYQGRVVVLVAEEDRVIPRQHGERLYQALETEKRYLTFPRAGHSDWPRASDAQWWDAVVEFLKASPP